MIYCKLLLSFSTTHDIEIQWSLRMGNPKWLDEALALALEFEVPNKHREALASTQ